MPRRSATPTLAVCDPNLILGASRRDATGGVVPSGAAREGRASPQLRTRRGSENCKIGNMAGVSLKPPAFGGLWGAGEMAAR